LRRVLPTIRGMIVPNQSDDLLHQALMVGQRGPRIGLACPSYTGLGSMEEGWRCCMLVSSAAYTVPEVCLLDLQLPLPELAMKM